MAAKDSSPSKILYPEWQNEYQAALLELDRQRLGERVAATEAAIYKRLQTIAESSNHCRAPSNSGCDAQSSRSHGREARFS